MPHLNFPLQPQPHAKIETCLNEPLKRDEQDLCFLYVPIVSFKFKDNSLFICTGIDKDILSVP